MNQRGSGLILFLIPAAIVILVVILATLNPLDIFFQLKHQQVFKPSSGVSEQANTSGEDDYFADTADLSSCGDKQELFILSPLKLEDFTFITPLGLLSPTAHVFPSPHLYFNVRKSQPGNEGSLPVEVPVVAPADLTIVSAKYIETKERPDYNDGMVTFGVCKEFKGYFDHLKTYAPKIKEAYDKAPVKRCDEYALSYPDVGKINFKNCEKIINVKIAKGEAIGTAGGGEGQRVFDFGSFDSRVTPKKFANPKRWLGREHLIYLTCGLDYYSQDLQNELKNRLGGYGRTGVIQGAACGEVIQDIPGSAMGAWVPTGTEAISHEPPYLALAHDYIEPQYLVFSMGESGKEGGLGIGKYTFLPEDSGMVNRHFKDIKADGKVYCFETEDTRQGNVKPKVNILVTMPTADRLRVQKYEASGCGSPPAGGWQMTNYAEFER